MIVTPATETAPTNIEYGVSDTQPISAHSKAFWQGLQKLSDHVGRELTKDDVKYISRGWFGHAELYRIEIIAD